MVYVYTDGSSSGGVGPGGYGWLVVVDGEVWHAGFGHGDNTTNNLMEMKAAVEGILYTMSNAAYIGLPVTIVSDSDYVIGIAKGTKTPQKNLAEAQVLRDLALMSGAQFQWIRGHSGDIYNDAADSLAKMGKIGYFKNPKQKKINKKKRREMVKYEE